MTSETCYCYLLMMGKVGHFILIQRIIINLKMLVERYFSLRKLKYFVKGHIEIAAHTVCDNYEFTDFHLKNHFLSMNQKYLTLFLEP